MCENIRVPPPPPHPPETLLPPIKFQCNPTNTSGGDVVSRIPKLPLWQSPRISFIFKSAIQNLHITLMSDTLSPTYGSVV